MAKKPDRNYVQRSYLRVQKNVDQDIHNLLMRSLSDVDDQLRKILGTSIGDQIRREQLLTVKKVMHEQVSGLMKKVGYTVEQAKHDAAAAAIRSSGAYERVLMQSAHIPKDLIDYYQKSAIATAQRGVNAAMERLMGSSYVPLAKSVYKTSQWTSGVVDRYVDSALARGLSARELAHGVRDMIRPDVRGGVSYAAMRLGRTEINNAFHATNAAKAAETPWVEGVRWVLSGRHPTPDDCNTYAEEALNPPLPPGVWPKDMVPMKPHPQCLCTTVNELPSVDSFTDAMLAGEYDDYLDKVMAKSGYSADYIKASRLGPASSASAGTPPAPKMTRDQMVQHVQNEYLETMRDPNLTMEKMMAAQEAMNRSLKEIENGTFSVAKKPTASVTKLKDMSTETLSDLRRNHRNSQALAQYRGSEYQSINGVLRGTARGNASTAGFIQGLDEDFRTSAYRTPTSTTVYRGVSQLHGDFVEGKYAMEKSFLSVTTDEAKSRMFNAGGHGWIMEIRAPKGTKFFPGTEHEQELIFNRGSRFKVLKRDDANHRLILELLGED